MHNDKVSPSDFFSTAGQQFIVIFIENPHQTHRAAALKAEGMTNLYTTYGLVRSHMLFNLSAKYWRNAGDPVAEAVCTSTIVAMHMLMSAPGAAEQVVDALHKLAANVNELREYAKNQA